MLPLKGLRVLDFSSLLPGPFATLYLGDWGAEVTVVEAPGREDLAQVMPPFADGQSTTYGFLGRNKTVMVVDLKTPDGRQKILDLIPDTDIVVQQFRPGTMEKLGFGYETLKKINPKLIYASISGYGQEGPMRDRAGHDINYAARSGVAVMNGSLAAGPVPTGVPLCDLGGSLHGVIGILMALYHRERTGEGQAVDISLAASGLFLSSLWAQMELAAGQSPRWESTELNGAGIYGFYRTKDQRYLSVGTLEPKFVKGFLEAIGGLSWLGVVLSKLELKQKVAARIAQETLQVWQEIFSKVDVCVEPVQEFEEIFVDPHHEAQQWVVEVPVNPLDPLGKKQKQLAIPLRFSGLSPQFLHIGQGRSR